MTWEISCVKDWAAIAQWNGINAMLSGKSKACSTGTLSHRFTTLHRFNLPVWNWSGNLQTSSYTDLKILTIQNLQYLPLQKLTWVCKLDLWVSLLSVLRHGWRSVVEVSHLHLVGKRGKASEYMHEGVEKVRLGCDIKLMVSKSFKRLNAQSVSCPKCQERQVGMN